MLIIETAVFTRQICALLGDDAYALGDESRILMLPAYAKNSQTGLSPGQIKALRRAVAEEWG